MQTDLKAKEYLIIDLKRLTQTVVKIVKISTEYKKCTDNKKCKWQKRSSQIYSMKIPGNIENEFQTL